MTTEMLVRPYVGLRAFRDEDRTLFFGRLRESHKIAALWRANRLTVLYGTSGVGKTSLLQAGVIPRLHKGESDVWRIGRLAPGLVSTTGNPFTNALLASWSPDTAPSAQSLAEYLATRPERTDRYGDPVPTLIAIDQAEELFSDFPRLTEEREAFIEELATALRTRPGLRLLLSLREDYLAAVLPYEGRLGQGARARFQLCPFDPAAALEAASRPLERTGREFARDAAETLVNDLRTIKIKDVHGAESVVTVETVEPVQLQVVCASLWESLPPDVRIITPVHVREHANVDRFLAGFCGTALTAVAREHGQSATEIRAWLKRTFVTELGTRGTAYQGLTSTAGMSNAVVRALEDRHVLRAEQRSGSRWYELQHDRLIGPLRQADSTESLQAAEAALAISDLATARYQAEEAQRSCGDDLRTQAKIERLRGDIDSRGPDLEAAQIHYRNAASQFEVLGDSAAVGRLLTCIGRLSLRLGQPGSAAAELQAAITRIPTDLGTRTELGWALWHHGRPAAAVSVLGEVLAVDRDMAEALRARGEILADLGRAPEALDDLNRVRSGQGPATVAARALALALDGRLEAAEQEAEDAHANAGDDGPTLLRVARVRALRGNPVGAAELAERALSAAERRLPRHLRDEAVKLVADEYRPAP
jgi:tetratricopeptide (TPR) repeat protein